MAYYAIGNLRSELLYNICNKDAVLVIKLKYKCSCALVYILEKRANLLLFNEMGLGDIKIFIIRSILEIHDLHLINNIGFITFCNICLINSIGTTPLGKSFIRAVLNVSKRLIQNL